MNSRSRALIDELVARLVADEQIREELNRRCKTQVFVCVACDAIAFSNRPQSITCSGRCRVRLCRRPDLARRMRDIERIDPDITLCIQARLRAIERLRPGLIVVAARQTTDWGRSLVAAWDAFVRTAAMG